MFISRRCCAVYDLRRQAPASTTTRIPDLSRPKNLSPARRLSDLLLLPSRLPQKRKKKKKTLQFFRLFRYAYPSSSFRCSRKRPSLLSLACASGRLSFAVRERYYRVIPFCNLFPRTYIRRRLIPYYDSGPLRKHQIYIRPIFHFYPYEGYRSVTPLDAARVNRTIP